MSEDRILAAASTTKPSTATVIRPLPMAMDWVVDPAHRLPVSGTPTEPPR